VKRRDGDRSPDAHAQGRSYCRATRGDCESRRRKMPTVARRWDFQDAELQVYSSRENNGGKAQLPFSSCLEGPPTDAREVANTNRSVPFFATSGTASPHLHSFRPSHMRPVNLETRRCVTCSPALMEREARVQAHRQNRRQVRDLLPSRRQHGLSFDSRRAIGTGTSLDGDTSIASNLGRES
jgi:hypothetical protein